MTDEQPTTMLWRLVRYCRKAGFIADLTTKGVCNRCYSDITVDDGKHIVWRVYRGGKYQEAA